MIQQTSNAHAHLGTLLRQMQDRMASFPKRAEMMLFSRSSVGVKISKDKGRKRMVEE